jgi:hypothetical protein
MPDNVNGSHAHSSADRQKFEDEMLRLVASSERAGVTLRVMGSLAFWAHCPYYNHLQAAMGHMYADIDFAADSRDRPALTRMMTELGYAEQREVTIVSEGRRMIFEHSQLALHVDVFFDKFDFCHEISWSNGRLTADAPTLPLAEMLLQKMQIVKINEKDIVDTIVVLLEHPLGDHDAETINSALVAALCAADWGLWRTTTMNLGKVRQLAAGYHQLSDAEKAHVSAQVDALLARIEEEPKPLAWKLRDRVGDRVKWYKDVDEV